MGPRAVVDVCEKRELLPVPGFEPRSAQAVAKSLSDYIIPAPTKRLRAAITDSVQLVGVLPPPPF